MQGSRAYESVRRYADALRPLMWPIRKARRALSALLRPIRRKARARKRRQALAQELRGRTPVVCTDRPVLILLHPRLNPRLNDVQAKWLQDNFPELAALMEYRLLPVARKVVESSSAVVFWVQDPVEHISKTAWRQCLAVETMCLDAGIPVINRPSNYHRVDRLEASQRLRKVGLRTPEVEVIEDWESFRNSAADLAYPFVIRNRHGQTGQLFRIEAPQDLDDPRIGTLREPVKVEWLDVIDLPTGVYRKYRTFVIGNRVIPHHLQMTRDWVTRGAERLKDAHAMSEELEFIRAPSPCASGFRRAARDFGLEVLAFDWAYCDDGKPVVWEANPYPFVWFGGPEGQGLYRAEAIHRTYASLTELYLATAGFPVPDRISSLSSLDPKRFASAAVGLRVVY